MAKVRHSQFWDEDPKINKLRKKKREVFSGDDLRAQITNGLVCEIFPNQAQVLLDDGVQKLCSYRRSLLQGLRDETSGAERSLVTVGDRVWVGKEGVIEKVGLRTNFFQRRVPGKDSERIHVLGANLDGVVIVASLTQPEVPSALIDRLCLAARVQNIPIYLCFTKQDCLEGKEPILALHYQGIGKDIVVLTHFDPKAIAQLREKFWGKKMLFCGASGVGKTSLMRALLKNPDWGRVGAVSEDSKKGRHTTTSSRAACLGSGTVWIDTPGIKEFGVVGASLEDLYQEFKELQNTCQCVQSNQQRICPVVLNFRHESYLKLLKSLTY